MKKTITYSEVREVYQKKGYKFYDNKTPYNINIGGVRAENGEVNKFDDIIFIYYRDKNGTPFFKTFKATTDPGLYWMLNPMNVMGTGYMVENQYHQLFKLGYHKGYLALIQNKPVKLYRDNNRDNVADLNVKTIVSGMFNVNLHHAGEDSIQVDKWSAACQVIAKLSDFDEFMGIIVKSLVYYPKGVFTYTLLNEKDFR